MLLLEPVSGRLLPGPALTTRVRGNSEISVKAEFQGSRHGWGRNQSSLPRQLSGLEFNS